MVAQFGHGQAFRLDARSSSGKQVIFLFQVALQTGLPPIITGQLLQFAVDVACPAPKVVELAPDSLLPSAMRMRGEREVRVGLLWFDCLARAAFWGRI